MIIYMYILYSLFSDYYTCMYMYVHVYLSIIVYIYIHAHLFIIEKTN